MTVYHPVIDHRSPPPAWWCPYCGGRAPYDTTTQEAWAAAHMPCQEQAQPADPP